MNISQRFKNTAISEDILISLDFNSSQKPIFSDSLTTSSLLSSLRFLQTPLDHILNSQQPNTVFSKVYRLTRTQAKNKNIIIAPFLSYLSLEDTSTLLSILANGNNSKFYKPKTYKQATSGHCRHHENWEKAIQDKIDFFPKNNTWSLLTLSSGS